MRRLIGWLIVSVILLAACGEVPASAPGAPAGAGEPSSSMPLPGSEKTRVAGQQARKEQANKQQEEAAAVNAQPASPTSIPASPTSIPASATPDPPTPIPTNTFLPAPALPTAAAAPVIDAVILAPTAAAPPAAIPLPPAQQMVQIEDDVIYQAADGAPLVGTIYAPGKSQGLFPAVLLLAMHVENRTAWDSFAYRLAEAGFVALTLDLRGQGESPGQANWGQALPDIQAVWEQFLTYPKVDRQKTAIIGASSGANLALLALQADRSIRTAVLISPGESYFGLETRPALAGLGARHVLVIASQMDRIAGTWPEQMAALSSKNITLRSFPGQTHGTALIVSELGATNLVINWLDEQLVESIQPAAPVNGGSFLSYVFTFLACLAGIFLIALAAALVVVRARRTRQAPELATVAPAAPSREWAEAHGTIARVLHSAAHQGQHTPAALRLVVDAPSGAGQTRLYDQTLMFPFLLENPSGSLQVTAAPEGVRLRCKEIRPNPDQLAAAARALNLPEEYQAQPDYRYTLWQLDEGDEVVILGDFQSQQRLSAREVGRPAEEVQISATTALRAGQTQALLRGQIVQVDGAVDRNAQRPLALVRMLVEEYDPQDAYVIVGDIRRASRAFLVQDRHGSIWVECDPERVLFQGAGSLLSDEQAQNALHFPGMPPLTPGRPYRVHVWQYRQGDTITLNGDVTHKDRAVLAAREIETSSPSIPLLPINKARPEHGRVRLRGRIAEVGTALDSTGSGKAPLALLRLRIEEETDKGWNVRLDETRSGSFRLEDSSGSIWISQVKPSGDELGEGTPTSQQNAEQALHSLGLPARLARGKQLRYWIWEYRLGHMLSVSGHVHTHTWLSEQAASEFIPALVGQVSRQRSPFVFPALNLPATLLSLLIGVGMLLLCVGIFWILSIAKAWLF